MRVHVCEMQPLDLPEFFPGAKYLCSGLLKIAAGARLRGTGFLDQVDCGTDGPKHKGRSSGVLITQLAWSPTAHLWILHSAGIGV